jgi:hypothetical protein
VGINRYGRTERSETEKHEMKADIRGELILRNGEVIEISEKRQYLDILHQDCY